MARTKVKEILDVAMLPLADGRLVMIPLQVLAEVQQLNPVDQPEGRLGELVWRGHQLPIGSLDAVCGLPRPDHGRLTTVGIFKAGKDTVSPFRALAFSGTASHGRIDSSRLEPQEVPEEGHFVGATLMHEEVYLIPDLPGLLFTAG